MYCTNCGAKLAKNSEFCSECGRKVIKNTNQVVVENEGNESILWGFIGFISPIAGLILYIVWKETRPKASKASGIGALINLALCLLVLILYIILILFVFATTM